jgi:hypothetical protein
MARVPGKYEALSSNPSTTGKKKIQKASIFENQILYFGIVDSKKCSQGK